jgi:hypothetical protein
MITIDKNQRMEVRNDAQVIDYAESRSLYIWDTTTRWHSSRPCFVDHHLPNAGSTVWCTRPGASERLVYYRRLLAPPLARARLVTP